MLKYKYPRIANWLIYKKLPDGDYRVIDALYGGSYQLSARIVNFARRLDGMTDPYELFLDVPDSEVDEILEILEEMELLRTSRVLISSIWTGIYLTIWTPRKKSPRRRCLCSYLNKLLLLTFLPVFFFGGYVYVTNTYNTFDNSPILNMTISLILGFSIHDVAHGIACVAYGGTVYETGLRLSLVPSGIYVLYTDITVNDPLKKAQISAAGIEANMMLAGIFFFMAGLVPEIRIFFYIAFINTVLVIVNLLFSGGLDGEAIMSNLGVPISKPLKRCIASIKKSVLEEGKLLSKADPAILASCFTVCLTWLAYASLFLFNYCIVPYIIN